MNHHQIEDVLRVGPELPTASQVPVIEFANELIRLAEVVKHNLQTGVAPVQTLSQLNAMEPTIGVLRITGLQSTKEPRPDAPSIERPGYLRISHKPNHTSPMLARIQPTQQTESN